MKDKKCIYCKERMSCEKYLAWLKDNTDIFVPRANGCEKYVEVNEEE